MRNLLLSLTLFYSLSHADLYKCTDQNGMTVFTDQICKFSGAQFKPKPIMTNYKSVTLPISKSSKQKNNSNKGNSCPFFTATQLRNLRVKQQLIKGIPETEIYKRYGKPNDKESSGPHKETWKYKSDRFKREFVFERGCLTSWKKKTVGKKSRIFTD